MGAGTDGGGAQEAGGAEETFGEPCREGRWDDAPLRYPDPAVRILDPRFGSLVVKHAVVERISTGCRWAEGPVWFGDHRCLLWSDIPNNRILRWDEASGETSVFRQPASFTNGHTRDRLGRLVSCEHLTRRVTRTEHDGTVTVVADTWQGHALNAPNDVVVARDGAVWFTDPGYGIDSDYEGDRGSYELPTAVYRVDPSGSMRQVTTALERPNGLCFSPDESTLYVVDSGADHRNIVTFRVDHDRGRLSGKRQFTSMRPGTADGIRTDEHGNLWAAAGGGGDGFDGVHVFTPEGERIGQILLPESCANLCFGGRRGNRLFMAASQSVYALYVNVRGN